MKWAICALELKNYFTTPFHGWGSTTWRLLSHYEEAVYFLPLSFQKFLLLVRSTSERWKAESTLEPPSGFENGILGLGTQHLLNRLLCDKLWNFEINLIFQIKLLFLHDQKIKIKFSISWEQKELLTWCKKHFFIIFKKLSLTQNNFFQGESPTLQIKVINQLSIVADM